MDQYPQVYVNPDNRAPQTLSSKDYAQGLEVDPSFHTPLEVAPWHVEQRKSFEAATSSSQVDVPERRVCGLRRKTFAILFSVILVVVIGAIVGGVVGSQATKREVALLPPPSQADDQRNGTKPPDDASKVPPTAQSIIHPSSSISAVNWYDQAFRQAVLWQSNSSSLHISVWDSGNMTWKTHNISKMFQPSEITLKIGSPIASTVAYGFWAFHFSVYYLSPDNIIHDIYTMDASFTTWKRGSMHTNPRRAADTSQLAVTRPRCTTNRCAGEILFMYEDPAHNLVHMNGSTWDNPISTGIQITPGSSLSLVLRGPDAIVDNSTVSDVRLFYGAGGEMKQRKYLNFVSAKFDEVPEVPALGLVPALGKSLPRLFAVGAYDDYLRSLIVAATPENVLVGFWWDKGTWHPLPKLNILGGASGGKFSAFTMNNDRALFGISGGRISRYVLDQTNPTIFNFGEDIPLPS